VAAGLASRRQARPGVVVVVVLGLLGTAAVVISPTFAPLDLLAPAAALGTGVTVLRRLHAMAIAPAPTRRPGGISRRRMLVGSSAAVGFGAPAAGGIGQWRGGGTGGSREAVTNRLATATLTERAQAIPASAAFPELGTPTFLTANADFYRIDTALRVPNLNAADWSGDTWRMWRTVVDLPAGRHSIRARATDTNGTTQTAAVADPAPNGATGWPGTLVTVR
jgi:hypothetical protein